MPSIFDPPAGARTFNASDWLAAIDVQVRTPPSPPPIDEPITADSPPYRVPPADDEPLPTWHAAQPAAARRRLRNLPWAVLTWLVIAGGVNYVLYRVCLLLIAAGYDYTLENLILPALLVLAITALELLIWLVLAWRYERL